MIENTDLLPVRCIGIGGGGVNAINRIGDQLPTVSCIALDSDFMTLSNAKTTQRHDLSKSSAEENFEQITSMLDKAQLVFILAGLGGKTATKVAPIIANQAQEANIFSIGFVFIPFEFEGKSKQALANEAIEKMQETLDIVIAIKNQKLLQSLKGPMNIAQAFKIPDSSILKSMQSVLQFAEQQNEPLKAHTEKIRSLILQHVEAMM